MRPPQTPLEALDDYIVRKTENRPRLRIAWNVAFLLGVVGFLALMGWTFWRMTVDLGALNDGRGLSGVLYGIATYWPFWAVMGCGFGWALFSDRWGGRH